MMMERGHFKHTFAVGELEVGDLDNIGEGFHQEDKAQRHKDKRHIIGKGHGGKCSAEEKGTRITHEDSCRIEIVEEKSYQPSEKRRGKYAQLRMPAGTIGHGDEEKKHGDGCAGSQAVNPVGNIHGIDRTADNEG